MKNTHHLKRFKLTLEYDGTRYSGWQKQDDAKTIQGALLSAGAEIFSGPVDIQGSGRTDAGVHAMRYVAHLEASTTLAPLTIRIKFNDLLPADIAILDVEPCALRFHARHDCVARSYLYQISKRKTAFGKKYVWWVRDKLDIRAMAEAAQLFTGMHDFISFAEKQELKKSTRVLLHAVHIHEEDDLIIVRIIGSHFLWKMVRRMIGVLVEVGRHALNTQQVEALLKEHSNKPAPLTAPPSGLFFERAIYDEAELRKFLAEIAEQP
ncbi:MAG: tRNA pseudouridine(38-40) synthase TruA [Deltaproteobacteria bacterium RIFOXYD12_FULL_50_9]|nr:MAG: tRNA pseudouridine(38-40) synthase TruA [Deltaproteobacteria bacterium RIFOXYD12_FULL_50_9]